MSIKTALTGLVRGMRLGLGQVKAGPETDPLRYIGNLFALPNPDPILRAMGEAERVYHSILVDSHVIGEVRSIRGSFRSHEYRLVPGNEDDPASMAARDFIEDWMKGFQPNEVADWMEIFWQMTSSIFTGYHAHEIVWEHSDGQYLPAQILDRPGRRFRFDAWSAPLLITNANLYGEKVDPYQFLVARHMATIVNPYGIPLLSSCFWPWTFKTGGWRYFVKYCERHGLPWPFAKYPQGLPQEEQDALADALANMLEAGYVMAPDGTGLELLTPKSSGSDLPQASLIDMCNREISKALTGQSMVGELHNTGARAASETAFKRQDAIHNSDREIAVSGFGQLARWMTLFNFGPDVAPPKLEFFRHTPAGLDRAKTYQLAADMGAKPSRDAMLEELGIPQAEDDEDALQPRGGLKTPQPGPDTSADPVDTTAEFSRYLGHVRGFSFAKAAGMTEDEAVLLASEAADQAIESGFISPIADMLAQFEADGRTLAEFKTAFEEQSGQLLDDTALRDVISQALAYSVLRGAATQAE